LTEYNKILNKQFYFWEVESTIGRKEKDDGNSCIQKIIHPWLPFKMY
jgi:hypothetical protein